MQKITPFLWFDNQAEEAANFYVSIFKNSKILSSMRYNKESGKVSGRKEGSVMVVNFSLEGYEFAALNGGKMPGFELNPAVSFMLNFDPSKDKGARKNLEKLWKELSQGGTPLMELKKYPFSELYGWIKDKYGVTWQLILSNPKGEDRPFITPSLMFTGKMSGDAEKAIEFYVSFFKKAKRGISAKYPPGAAEDEGNLMFADFMLDGQWFAAMDSGRKHSFTLNGGISFVINCKNQEEVDYFWGKLLKGGKAQQCGWLADKYGVTWQIVPVQLNEYLGGKDKAGAQRAMAAMLKMEKLDVEALKRAYNGK